MDYFSFSNRPKRKREKFDNQMQAVYKVTYDKNGIRHCTKDKEVNIYEKIQEYANDCNLTNMFSKYGLDSFGQLKDSEAQLIDLTNLPTNLQEAMTIINNAKYAFDRQSKEIKEKFNNDFNQFIAASETGKLAQVLNEELKVSAERFNTANMANFDANNVNLINHNAVNAFTAPNSSPQGNIQPTQAQNIQQTQNTQQGVNLNV